MAGVQRYMRCGVYALNAQQCCISCEVEKYRKLGGPQFTGAAAAACTVGRSFCRQAKESLSLSGERMMVEAHRYPEDVEVHENRNSYF